MAIGGSPLQAMTTMKGTKKKLLYAGTVTTLSTEGNSGGIQYLLVINLQASKTIGFCWLI